MLSDKADDAEIERRIRNWFKARIKSDAVMLDFVSMQPAAPTTRTAAKRSTHK